MERYDSYRDSGVEWIGEIPSHWARTKYKYHFRIKGGFPFDSGLITNEPTKFPIIRIGNVTSGEIDVYYMGEMSEKIPVVEKGDYVVSLTGDFSIRRWERSTALLNQRCGLVVPLGDLKSRYLFYLLPQSFSVLEETKYFTTLKNLSNSEVEDIEMCCPPLHEQEQIVEYLDRKTTLIDSLIEKTVRKIELLKEKRTSLINEVVTKGLNSEVEMKDSGVEWIGEIPSHWERKRLKHISESVNGYSFKSDDFDREHDIPVLRIGDVGDSIDFSNCVKVKSHFLEEKSEFIVKKGDILIGLTGGTIGKSGRYSYDSPSLLNQRVGLLRNKDSVLNGLLHHYVNSEVFIRYIFYDCYGGGQDNISMNDILNMVFPFPPLYEQQRIVQYLDEQTSIIDSTITTEEKRIELLKEYRQSLISEVVTGKVKVTRDE